MRKRLRRWRDWAFQSLGGVVLDEEDASLIFDLLLENKVLRRLCGVEADQPLTPEIRHAIKVEKKKLEDELVREMTK